MSEPMRRAASNALYSQPNAAEPMQRSYSGSEVRHQQTLSGFVDPRSIDRQPQPSQNPQHPQQLQHPTYTATSEQYGAAPPVADNSSHPGQAQDPIYRQVFNGPGRIPQSGVVESTQGFQNNRIQNASFSKESLLFDSDELNTFQPGFAHAFNTGSTTADLPSRGSGWSVQNREEARAPSTPTDAQSQQLRQATSNVDFTDDDIRSTIEALLGTDDSIDAQNVDESQALGMLATSNGSNDLLDSSGFQGPHPMANAVVDSALVAQPWSGLQRYHVNQSMDTATSSVGPSASVYAQESIAQYPTEIATERDIAHAGQNNGHLPQAPGLTHDFDSMQAQPVAGGMIGYQSHQPLVQTSAAQIQAAVLAPHNAAAEVYVEPSGHNTALPPQTGLTDPNFELAWRQTGQPFQYSGFQMPHNGSLPGTHTRHLPQVQQYAMHQLTNPHRQHAMQHATQSFEPPAHDPDPARKRQKLGQTGPARTKESKRKCKGWKKDCTNNALDDSEYCGKCIQQYDRATAGPPAVPYLPLEWNDVLEEVWPTSIARDAEELVRTPGLKQQREESRRFWVGRILEAIAAPVAHEAEKQAKDKQQAFNGCAMIESGHYRVKQRQPRYTSRKINAAAHCLFECVLRLHNGGRSLFPAAGDNRGYQLSNLDFIPRLEHICRVLAKDKHIACGLIEIRGIKGFAECPEAFENRKKQNKDSNTRKDQKLKNATQELELLKGEDVVAGQDGSESEDEFLMSGALALHDGDAQEGPSMNTRGKKRKRA